MCQLFSGGLQDHVPVLLRSTRSPRLEEVLHSDTDLALDTPSARLRTEDRDSVLSLRYP